MKTRMWEPLVEALGTFKSSGTEEKELLMNQLLVHFHPNHSMILDMKLEVANKLCRANDGNIENANREELEKKKAACEEILGVMNIIYPGRSKYRGLLLHELGDTIMALTGKLYSMEVIGKDAFQEGIKMCHDYLDEGIDCLKHDRIGSFENGICQKMKNMQDSCKDFDSFINFL